LALITSDASHASSPPPTASTISTRHGKKTIRNSLTVWIVASLSVKYWWCWRVCRS
jgi:hypothetical protein